MLIRRCKSLLSVAVLTLVSLAVSGCMVGASPATASSRGTQGLAGSAFPVTPVSPTQGALVSYYTAPLQTDYEGERVGLKRGVSETYYIKEPFLNTLSAAFKDGSIEEAMRDGGITTVSHIDYQVLQVLGLFGRFQVIVYGE